MTELITRSGAWLLQQAATLPDTVVLKATERGWFETLTGIASGVLALTILGLAVVLGPAAWSFWRSFRKVRELLDKVYADVTPLTRHASNIADNLDYITTSIRSDVQQVNATIALANRRLQQAVQVTETRLNEFNALLHVVQQEAEQAFVSTASVVRGVRTGAAEFGRGGDAADDTIILEIEDQEEAYDGDDGELDEGPDPRDGEGDEPVRSTGGAARPRLRPRRHSRRRD